MIKITLLENYIYNLLAPSLGKTEEAKKYYFKAENNSDFNRRERTLILFLM